MKWLRSWWQKTSKTLDAVVILMIVVLIALVVVIVLGYKNNWTWAGLHGKTLYDWLQLLIVPTVLAVGGYLFNIATSRNEQKTTIDNQREAAMKEYFDKMSELMLHENLRKSDLDSEVRQVARVLTLIVLPRLDGRRKARVLQFLYESGLIEKGKRIVDLYGVDFSEVVLFATNLSKADLRGANLRRANLIGVGLTEANLTEANLTEADLFGADLIGANLSKADLFEASLTRASLRGANLSRTNLLLADLQEADLQEADLRTTEVTAKQLNQVKSLKDAIMPDGTKHA